MPPDLQLTFKMRGAGSGMSNLDIVSDSAGNWQSGMPIAQEKLVLVAYSYDGAGQEKLYVNGSKVSRSAVQDVAVGLWQAADIGAGLYSAIKAYNVALDDSAVLAEMQAIGTELGVDFSYPAPGFDEPVQQAQKNVLGAGFDAVQTFSPSDNTYLLEGTGAGGKFGGLTDSGVTFTSQVNESFEMEARFEWVGTPDPGAQLGLVIRRQAAELQHRALNLFIDGNADIELSQRENVNGNSTVTAAANLGTHAWLKIVNRNDNRSYECFWKENEGDVYQQIGATYVDTSPSYNLLRRNSAGGNAFSPKGNHLIGFGIAGNGSDCTGKVSGVRFKICLPDQVASENALIEIAAGDYHTGLPGNPTSYTMTGAPAGLTIGATSGLIVGIITPGAGSAVGTVYPIQVTYTTDSAATTTIQFEMVVFAGAAAISPGNPSFTTDRTTQIAGNLIVGFADNGLGGTNGLSVSSVNGSAVSVGQQITLDSGAIVNIAANGDFTYDPGGNFTDNGGNDSCLYEMTNGQETVAGLLRIVISATNTFIGNSGLPWAAAIAAWDLTPLDSSVSATQNCVDMLAGSGVAKTFTYQELGANPEATIDDWRINTAASDRAYCAAIYLQNNGQRIELPVSGIDNNPIGSFYSDALFGGFARLGQTDQGSNAPIGLALRGKLSVPLPVAISGNAVLLSVFGSGNQQGQAADRELVRLEYPTDPRNLSAGKFDSGAAQVVAQLHDAGDVTQLGGGTIEQNSLAPYVFAADIAAGSAANTNLSFYRGGDAAISNAGETVAPPASAEIPVLTFDGSNGGSDSNPNILRTFVLFNDVPAGDLGKRQAACDWGKEQYLDNVVWASPAPLPPPPPQDDFQEDINTYNLVTNYANPLTQAAVNAFGGTNPGPNSHILWNFPGDTTGGGPFCLHQLWSNVPGTNNPYPISANHHRSETTMPNTRWNTHFQDTRRYIYDAEFVVHTTNLRMNIGGGTTHIMQCHSRPTNGRQWTNPPWTLECDALGRLYLKIFQNANFNNHQNVSPDNWKRAGINFPGNLNNAAVVNNQLNQIYKMRIEYKISTVNPTDAYIRGYLDGTKIFDTGQTYLGFGFDNQPNLFGKIGLYAPGLTNVKQQLAQFNNGYFAVGWRRMQLFEKIG